MDMDHVINNFKRGKNDLFDLTKGLKKSKGEKLKFSLLVKQDFYPPILIPKIF